MAKWGEGDPRWIVEERPDATNVNNWHWTEKNACQWSKDKLKDLLVDLRINTSAGPCKITELEKCEGDASANNRKAKIIIFFEWELRLKWKGTSKDSDETVEGTIDIPNLSDENGVEDLDIQFLTESKKADAEIMKSALRTEGTRIVTAQLGKYVQLLKEEFTQGMILPQKEASSSSFNKGMSGLKLNEKAQNGVRIQTQNTPSEKVILTLTDLETSTSMKCSAFDVYNALTKPEMFVAFTHGSGKIEPKIGGTFEMFGGNVHGKILELEEPNKIVQEWRFKTWPDGHYSKVTFKIEQKDDSTEINVHQTGIPQSDLEKTKEGWEKYYWDAMKRTFGFGSLML